MSMPHLKSLSPHVILLSAQLVTSVDHCCISHLKIQGGGGLMSRGAYRQKQYFCLQEDEPITGERGGGAYNTAVYGMIT